MKGCKVAESSFQMFTPIALNSAILTLIAIISYNLFAIKDYVRQVRNWRKNELSFHIWYAELKVETSDLI